MKLQQAIERINESIEEIIGNYVELKPNGNKLTACCPLHGEKSPSFYVTPHKSMYKCFGCQKGGDAISFIREIEQSEFIDAVKKGASILKIDIEWEKRADAKDFDQEKYRHQESIRIVNERVAEFYREQLQASPIALAYIAERGFEASEDDTIGLGFAPESGKDLVLWAKKNSINTALLKEAGLVREKDGREYDFYRNRIMFPIRNKSGKVVGFTGRTLEKDSKYKYINTAESEIFVKGNELFALSAALPTIRKENRAYLVEGNFDVKRMHDKGCTNTIAPCGTALTPEQATLLSKYTKNVTLIYDGDDAGRKAIIRNGEILVKQQFNVSVVTLPQGEDPDSFFLKEDFETYKDENQIDYLFYVANLNAEACAKNPAKKADFMKHLCNLIAHYDEAVLHSVYIDHISEIIKPKKAWQDQLNLFLADRSPKVAATKVIPKGVSLEEFKDRGFYEEHNCYHFANQKGEPVQRSNFTIKPLFHIESTINAKRLFELTNRQGIVRVIEIPQKDLVAIQNFKIKIESLGNFLWTGAEADLNRLKAWIYENMTSAFEVVQMGWQKQGFFAWGNGLFVPEKGEFIPVDEYGIVQHANMNYYIPAFSKIYTGEDSLYQFERRFIHIEGNVTMSEYVRKFVQVYGDTGKMAFCFYLASLFRDVITSKYGFFPILNLFGQKGAGKTECAHSLLHLFGPLPKGPNINSITKAAIGDHLASSSNAICHIDEYRNDLDMEKRELLKNIWDIRGRTRKNMDKDKKNETTAVDQALIMTGQQMPTADVALFTRVMFLAFNQTEYNDQEKKTFNELKDIEKRGLTHLTNQILKLRGVVKDTYAQHVKKVNAAMQQVLNGETIEDRIYNNWMVVLAAFSAVYDHIDLPWDYEELIRTAVKLMRHQNAEIKASDDLGHFWKIIEYLCSSNILFAEGDYKIKGPLLKINHRKMEGGKWISDTIEWKDEKTVLYLSTTRVFSLYKMQCAKEGDKAMPEATIEYYLKNSKAFICETKKENFKKLDAHTGYQLKDENGEGKRTATTALCFDLSMLNINVATHIEKEAEAEPTATTETTTPKQLSDLPF